MLSFHILKTVAQFEIRTLLRGWFFRIFAGLTIISLGIFNISVFVDASGAPWIFRALPAAIPYANLIILNLGQAIVAIFLASEFLKQDKKNDTVEVIYARSMTNAEYILGKALGVLSVFLLLNLAVLIMGIGFSFLSSDSSQGIGDFFLYPLLISLPTLVFILGLSFFFMIIFKNQAITFILLLGYIALTIFYLGNKVFHVFDYIAYNVPMMNSTIGGFGNIEEILLHRAIYLFLGLGLIFFTIFKIQRLPQARMFKAFPLYIAIALLAVGGLFIKKYIDLKKGNIEYKKQLIELNDLYVDAPKVKVETCHIDLEHRGEQIIVQASMQLINETNADIDSLIFSLNPSLNIISAELNGKKTKFTRNLQIVKFPCPESIAPKKTAQLVINYEGNINENTHFLDLDLEDYEDNFEFMMFRIRKRYAYLQDNFVCLTSESLWYPVSGTGFSTKKPTLYLPDFTNYSLKVKTNKKLMAISQGAETNNSDGVFEFQPEYPLPKISLLIGNYEKYTKQIDSIEYNLYSIKGNEYFKNHFIELQDSLPEIIRGLKNEYETFIGFEYPFQRFNLAEVPIHFALDKHVWSVSSDAVQPEIIFLSEKGVLLEDSDFKKRKIRAEKQMKRDNEEVSDEELQARILKRFVRGNFMATPEEYYRNDITDRNTFTLFPQYYTFVSQLNSPEWPVLNMAFEAYLKDRNTSSASSRRWFWRGISKGELLNLELKRASLEELIENGIEKTENEDERILLNEVVLAKGNFLFSLFKARYGEAKFNDLLNRFVADYKHLQFSFQSLDSVISQSFGDTISKEVDNWYSTRQLPGFLVKDVETYKVVVGEYTKYQVRFKISNPEAVDGLVSVSVEMTNEGNNRSRRNDNELSNTGFSKEIYLPAQSAQEIGFVFTTEPARMNIFSHISAYLPNNLNYDFSSFDQIRKTAVFDTAVFCPVFVNLEDKNETIVDNEDTGFEYRQKSNQSYLKSLIKKDKEQRYKYTGFRFWSPPSEWKSILRTGFYGKYVRSGMYTKTGNGERTVSWKCQLENEGYYDIYCHIEKFSSNRRRNERKKPDYNFSIYHDDGVEIVNMGDGELEMGWNYLGSFYISSDSARVELSNKSIGSWIFADAIKWIESE